MFLFRTTSSSWEALAVRGWEDLNCHQEDPSRALLWYREEGAVLLSLQEKKIKLALCYFFLLISQIYLTTLIEKTWLTVYHLLDSTSFSAISCFVKHSYTNQTNCLKIGLQDKTVEMYFAKKIFTITRSILLISEYKTSLLSKLITL